MNGITASAKISRAKRAENFISTVSTRAAAIEPAAAETGSSAVLHCLNTLTLHKPSQTARQIAISVSQKAANCP